MSAFKAAMIGAVVGTVSGYVCCLLTILWLAGRLLAE